jgi:hypothetical protein
MGSKPKPHPPPQTPVPLEDESLSTHQEAIAVPLVQGTRLVAAVWITPIYAQRTEEVPAERPGKK